MTLESISNGAGRVAGRAYRVARRVTVFVIGSTVLLIGIVFLVTPGPAFVVIPAGLGILAIEFAWARRWFEPCARDGQGRPARRRPTTVAALFSARQRRDGRTAAC